MRTKRIKIILSGLLAVLAVSAIFATSAGAAPAWKFSGTALTGKEDILGAAISSSMTVPGLTTTCEHFLYNMKIENSGGTGKGEITELPLYECHTTSPVCTVEAIGANKLPWPTKLTTVAGKNYLFVEGVNVSILYGGEECALGETEVIVSGTAAGLVENATESATFNASSFTATGAKLKVGGTAIEWNGVFPTEGFEWHREQPISVG
jgi:hypothetical protein